MKKQDLLFQIFILFSDYKESELKLKEQKYKLKQLINLQKGKKVNSKSLLLLYNDIKQYEINFNLEINLDDLIISLNHDINMNKSILFEKEQELKELDFDVKEFNEKRLSELPF